MIEIFTEMYLVSMGRHEDNTNLVLVESLEAALAYVKGIVGSDVEGMFWSDPVPWHDEHGRGWELQGIYPVPYPREDGSESMVVTTPFFIDEVPVWRKGCSAGASGVSGSGQADSDSEAV